MTKTPSANTAWWDRWGKQASYAALAVGLLAVSAYIAPTWIDFSILAGGATATLLTTATAYGFKGMQQGYSFWQGFSSYITHNWAQTYAIASLIFIAAVGVDRIVGALRNAGANKAPANAVRDSNAFPKDRLELHNKLLERGFNPHSVTERGYVKYTHTDGRYVWIKNTGEVITYNKVWLPDGSRKIPNRYYWDGIPIPTTTHSTGQFVEPFESAIFIPKT